jgi:predicted N-acetyltransferase YhbS
VPETTTTTQPVTTTTEPETPTTVTLVQTDDGQVIGSIWSNPVFLVVSALVLLAFLTITGAALLKTRFDKK